MSTIWDVIVVGAGVGGLSAAIHLAAAGRRVLLLEQNPFPGGKLAQQFRDGYRWDCGPSVITMRHVLEQLFATAGRRMDDYLTLQPVTPYTRYFYPDGTQLDLSGDLPRVLPQLRRLSEQDVEGYLRFLAYTARLYRVVAPSFIYGEPPSWGSLFRQPLGNIRYLDGWRTMSRAIQSFRVSPYLHQLLCRFATYVGSDPYRAPATLNVIAHVELNEGVWYPEGGVYRIVEALTRLAEELGVRIECSRAVERLEIANEKVQGVVCADGTLERARAVIANVDVTSIYSAWLSDHSATARAYVRKLQSYEPSCSGFIMLLGIRGCHPQLAHHNIFFSSDYRREFHEIFVEGVPPTEPTIYVAITSRSTPQDAPSGGENWFVLVNAPPLGSSWDWKSMAESYAERVLERLAAYGVDVRAHVAVRQVMTPYDIARATGAWRGALYGAASNSPWAAFRRPHNRVSAVRGVYLAGGSVHPGGGVPLALLSGRLASRLLIEDGY
jgi:phytoene desaturase